MRSSSMTTRVGRAGYDRVMGDNACWLDRVCLECGRFLESIDSDADQRCPHCGTELTRRPPPPPAGNRQRI